MARFVLDDASPAVSVDQTAPPAPQPSTARYVIDDPNYSPGYGAFQSIVGQGLALGFGDEIAAGIRSTFGDSTYEQALAEERKNLAEYKRRNPVLSVVGEVAGGFATPGLGVVGSVIRPAATAARRVAQAGGIGAATGGITGFGSAEGDATSRLEGAARGAALGGVLGTAAGGAGEAVRAIGRARANMGEAGAYGKIADDIGGGVDDLANQIATGATNQNAQINRRTLDILGEEMQSAGGNYQQAQARSIQRIMREANVTQATATDQIRRLTSAHADSNLMLGEYPAVSASDAAQRSVRPNNVNLDDLGRTQDSTTQAKLDYLANNGNAQSAQNVRNAVSARQEELAPSMRETLESFAPRVGNRAATIVDSADMQEAARLAGTVAYNAAHTSPLAIPAPQFQQAVDLFVAHHMARANSRSGDVGDAILQRGIREFFERDPATGAVMRNQAGAPVIIDVTGPNGLQRLQDARSALGAAIRKAERDGDGNTLQALQPMYRDTRPNVRTGAAQPDISRIMEAASPQWATANRAWADMNFLRMGEELGDAFATRAGPQFRTQLVEFRQLAPEAQNIVRIHFLQKLYDKLDNLGDTHGVSKLFSNDHSRNMIRVILGDQAAITFTRAVRDQKVAEASQRMMQNSATHRRGMAQRQMDAETGLVSAVQNANVSGVRNWLLERMTQFVTERRNRPMADILTTPMSDTARVAQHLHRMRQQQGVLRAAETPTTRPLGAAYGIGSEIGRISAPDDKRKRSIVQQP